jgi:tripartite-type tricarboxylate transporter receptor subunit TctC
MLQHQMLPGLSRIGLALFLLGAGVTAPLPASAETFPTRTIRIVVPTSPATPPDIISRIIASELGEAEGWKVVVENKPGAVTTVAGLDVLRQPADGYSIFAMSLPISAAPAFLPNMPFSPASDFAPVIKVSTSYNVPVVNPSVPARSVAELVALIKSQPNKLTFSSGGFGTPAHLIGELFMQQTGTLAVHVPYQQIPQAIGDLISGTNQFMFITSLPVVNLIATGKLRALAVTGPQRLTSMPDVPTIVEQGYPGLVVEDWVGFAVRSGTPNDVIARLNTAVNKVLAEPKVQDAFAKLGASPAGGTAADYGSWVTSQVALWSKVVKDSGIKLPQ